MGSCRSTISFFGRYFLLQLFDIISVDKKPIGNGKEGPIAKRIREAYRKLTRGEE